MRAEVVDGIRARGGRAGHLRAALDLAIDDLRRLGESAPAPGPGEVRARARG